MRDLRPQRDAALAGYLGSTALAAYLARGPGEFPDWCIFAALAVFYGCLSLWRPRGPEVAAAAPAVPVPEETVVVRVGVFRLPEAFEQHVVRH